MKKHSNLLLALIIFLAITIVGILYAYNRYYLPSAKAYSTYLEIYQEYECDEITSITISSINHRLVVKASTSDKVKIDYYQKADNSNTFSNVNGALTLDIIERTDDLDNLLFNSEKKIDVITIYLPRDTAYSLDYSTVVGSVTIDDAIFNHLSVNNLNAKITVNDITGNEVNLSSNAGEIVVNNCDVKKWNISNVTGEVKATFNEQLDEYFLMISTKYGSIVMNGETAMDVDEQGNSSISKYVTGNNTMAKRIAIDTVRSKIYINYVEPPVEQVDEVVEQQ